MTVQYDEGSGEPDIEGDKYWYVNDVLHREGGPAIEWNDGDATWLRWGQRHRLDGPAMDFPAENYKKWYVDDKLHRTDGPAIEWGEGGYLDSWWLNGEKAIELSDDQEVVVGKSLKLKSDVGIVLKHVKGVFYLVLLGNKKILVAQA